MGIDTIVTLVMAAFVIASSFACIIIWVIRLEGKVNTLNALAAEREKQNALISQRLENMAMSLDQNFNRVFDKLDKKADK